MAMGFMILSLLIYLPKETKELYIENYYCILTSDIRISPGEESTCKNMWNPYNLEGLRALGKREQLLCMQKKRNFLLSLGEEREGHLISAQ